MFSTKAYDRAAFTAANQARHELTFLEPRLDLTTVALAEGAEAVCAFVNDDLAAPVIDALADLGVTVVALRCAGFNNVDLPAAARRDITVVRVPSYSPNAVAEHTLALILALNRRIHKAYNRVREGNFALDGLLGFNLEAKTVGVVGTGQIGRITARLLWHLRCRVLAFDPFPDAGLDELGVEYVELDDLWPASDIITLNCPLTPETHHLVDEGTISAMRSGVMLVNTGRGALIDTVAVLDGLKRGHIGSLALDVYEEEASLFFEDRSQEIITDDVFARLLTFPNVLITAHQGFFTHEALAAIAETTIASLDHLGAGLPAANAVSA
ncbi:2-hydroxyacid dehydrogenase [soil metagenome]